MPGQEPDTFTRLTLLLADEVLYECDHLIGVPHRCVRATFCSGFTEALIPVRNASRDD